MKVAWDRRTNLPSIEFEESDFANANSIKQFLDGKFTCRKCGTDNDTNAWKVLDGYFASMRLAIEEIGKAHARSRAKKELCSNDFSILDGFDIATGIPRKIVLQAEKLRELEKQKEVVESGTDAPTDDYE